MAKDTPAARARQRVNPAVFRPPPIPKGNRRTAVRNLHLKTQGVKLTKSQYGRAYPIGANIEGQTPWSMGMDQAYTVTLPIRDPAGDIRDALGDEANLQQEGVLVTLDGVNMIVVGCDHDGEGLYTLTLEDETAWRLKQFSKFMSASRARVTRFGFIQRMVDEAGRKPYPRMRSFIPEIRDKQKIRKPSKT